MQEVLTSFIIRATTSEQILKRCR